MSQQFQLKLLEKIRVPNTDIMSFKFSPKYEQTCLEYKAGQFVIMDLGTAKDPEGTTRCFSIASSPTEKDFILISTRIHETPFKRKLGDLNVGDLISMKGPLGRFILHENYSKHAVMLSGGIGIVPFRSMIKYATDKNLPIKITLFYANRNEDNILYRSEFDEWAKTNPNLKIIYTLDESSSDWKGEQGFISKAMIMKYLGINEVNDSIFYICGPPGLLNAAKKLLREEMNISRDKIKIEIFGKY